MSKRSKAPIVGIDSDILIYSVRKRPTDSPAQDKLTESAQRLVSDLLHREATIFLSVISVAEFLVPSPVEKHLAQTQLLEETFSIAPFNLRAASVAARLKAEVVRHGTKEFRDGEREVLSADLKIIASLSAAEVQVMYTNDRGFLRAAKLLCDARMLGDGQGLLFGDPPPDDQ